MRQTPSLLLVVLAVACARAPAATLHPAAAPPPPFSIVEADATRTARTPDGCVSLELDRRWHTLVHRRGPGPACPRLEDALPLLRDMLVALDRDGELGSVSSFGVGRDYESFYARLAIAAARSPDWDPHRGTPRAGSPNAFVVRIANDPQTFFPEMVVLLAAVHLRPDLRSVEKVLIGTPSQTPFRERLAAAGIGARAKVPFDCILWFHLAPE